MNRNVGGVGIVAQQVEQDEPVDVGQAKVERDRAGPHLAHHRDRSRPGRGDDPLEPLLMGQFKQDAGERRVILDDQDEGMAVELVAVVGRRIADGQSATSPAPCASSGTAGIASGPPNDCLGT